MSTPSHSITTGYHDVDAVIAALSQGIAEALGESLVALWLTGSLTYGDYDHGSSDIDYCAVICQSITSEERARLIEVHTAIGVDHPTWRERIEGTYVTVGMLGSRIPPPEGRPYVNGGVFWEPDPPYGNEWILNLFVLQECGISLIGPEPCELIPPVAIADVRDASRRDLFEERLPEVDVPGAFDDPHIQAYVTLTLARILHREFNDEVASKRVAARWVKERYGEPWRTLLDRAESWNVGQPLDLADDVRRFMRFVASELSR